MALLGVQVLLEEMSLNKNEEGRQGYLSSDSTRDVISLLGNQVGKVQMAFPDSAHLWNPADEG